jgi:hypothetical protein
LACIPEMGDFDGGVSGELTVRRRNLPQRLEGAS